jgi:hypothetical protein
VDGTGPSRPGALRFPPSTITGLVAGLCLLAFGLATLAQNRTAAPDG